MQKLKDATHKHYRQDAEGRQPETRKVLLILFIFPSFLTFIECLSASTPDFVAIQQRYWLLKLRSRVHIADHSWFQLVLD